MTVEEIALGVKKFNTIFSAALVILAAFKQSNSAD
jgi:hypothetical protein